MNRSLSLLFALLPLSAAAQIQIVAGWDFGQFTFEGTTATHPDGEPNATSIPSNFSSIALFNPTQTHNGVTPVNSGQGSISWSQTNADNGYIFSTQGTRTVNTTMVDFAGSFLSNNNSDPSNLGLGFDQFGGRSFNLNVNLTGYGDYAPASYNNASNFSFAAASEGAVTISWFSDGQLLGTNTLSAGNLSTFSTYTLDLPTNLYGATRTITAQVSGNATFTLDNIQVNGVVVIPETPTVVQQPSPNTTANAGATVILEAVATAGGTPNLTYQWFKDGQPLSASGTISGVTTPTLTLANIALSSAGSYTLRITNGTVFVDTQPATLTVQTLPEITQAPAPNVGNPGQTVTFRVEANGVPAPSFQWFKDDVALTDGTDIAGSATATLTLSNISDAFEGAYKVVVSNAAGAVESAPVPLTVSEVASAPEITSHPSGTTIVQGQQAVFAVNATGAPAPEFRWRRNGVDLVDGANISGATTDTLVLTNVTASQAGAYTVFVSNSAGSTVSSEATLVVHVPPTINPGSGPASRNALVGESITLSVDVSGSPAPSFQWKKDGEDIPDANGAELTLSPVSLDDAGQYSVVITNSAGSVETDTAVLTVLSPPQIAIQPVNRTVNAGFNTTLSVGASGSPAPSYQWFKDGEPISGANSAQYPIDNAKASDAGVYHVRVSNAAGVVDSSGVTVLVTTPVAYQRTGTQTFVPGSTLLLNSPFTANNTRYQWFRNGKAIAGATSSTYLIENAATTASGVYTIKLYSLSGWNYATLTAARIVVSLAGTYDVLLRDEVSGEPIGHASVQISAQSAYTGRLTYEDGRVYAFKGSFGLAGAAYAGTSTASIVRRGLPTLTLILDLDARAGSLGVELAQASLALGSGESAPRATSVEWHGRYTLMLDPANDASAPVTAKASIDRRGLLRFSARMPDKRAFTAAVPGATDATYGLFLQIYGKTRGHVAGGLQLVPVGGGYRATPETSGLFYWFKPGLNNSPVPAFDITYEPTLAP